MDSERIIAIDKVKEKIVDYCQNHTSIKFDITDMEWQLFYENIYNFAEENQLTEFYYMMLWAIIYDALNSKYAEYAYQEKLYLVKNGQYSSKCFKTNQYITINSLIKSLKVLKSLFVKKEDVDELANVIRDNCILGEAVDFKRLIK